MTIVLPRQADDIRWYEVHLWLSPFSRWQGTIVTPLSPEEVGSRVYARILEKPQPETWGDAIGTTIRRFLGQAQPIEVTRPKPPSTLALTADGSIYGTLYPEGFSLGRHKADHIRFRVRYREMPNGDTRIDASFGWHWSWRWWCLELLSPLLYLSLLYGLIVLDIPKEITNPGFLLYALFISLALLATVFDIVFTYVWTSWSQRNDHEKYRELIIELLDAREIGLHP